MIFYRGLPPGSRLTIRRAHQQPRTDVTGATRGSLQQLRTGVRHAIRGNIKTFNICTYNTRTINDLNHEALETMLYEIQDINWDIIGLSETKMKESKIEILENSGHQLFFSGNEISRSHGFGFLVNKKMVPFVCDYDPISDRLAVLKLNGKFSKIVIVQTYFPTSEHPDEEVNQLYDQIQDIINKTSKRDHLIIMGDFNPKVGNLNTNYPKAIGTHTIGQHNSRGESLAKFCTKNDLVATNTLFKKRKLFTWISPDGKTKNQIDFILTRLSSPRQTIKNCSTLNYPDISDHKMLRSIIKMNFSWPARKTNNIRYDVEKLEDPGTLHCYQTELSNRFSILSTDSDSTTLYDDITTTITEAVANNLTKTKKESTTWLTDNTKRAIENKHNIRKTFGSNSSEYKIAKAETKKAVKKDKLKFTEQELDLLSKAPPHKQYYAAVRKLKTKQSTISWSIKDKNGKILTNKKQILERWAKFYEELYSDNTPDFNVDDSSEDKIPSILKSEISYAITNLKIRKSPGLDNIYSEYLKAGGDPLINTLQILFNKILQENSIPQAFKEALIVVIFKKGSRLDCENYRPISLLSHVYKLFITIVANRIKNDLYASFPTSQAAYQPGRGTIEQVIALEQIIEKSIEFNHPAYIVFIDFTKAFDSIKLPFLWKLLNKTTNINKRYINLLKSTYENSNATIKTDIGITQQVKICKGVKQGDVLSAILFCIVIAAIINQTENECNSGFPIAGRLISNLSYADDIGVINNSLEKLQSFINTLNSYANEVGLFINTKKTKCMTTNQSITPLQITINGQKIEQVKEFIYLGHKVSSVNDGSAAVQHRIGLGWAAFQKNKKILTSKRVPYHIKAKTYKTYILPVVLYGLECVNWTASLCNKIETFQNHIMRIMLNKKLTDHVTIDHLLKVTGLAPIMAFIKSKTLKLYGHIKRSQTGLSKICLEGMITGTRSRGNQKKRWRDNIYEWAELDLHSLNTLTQNRNIWKAISHVSAHSAIGGESD